MGLKNKPINTCIIIKYTAYRYLRTNEIIALSGYQQQFTMVSFQLLTLLALIDMYRRLSRSIACTEPFNWRCYGVVTWSNCKSLRSGSVVNDLFWKSNSPVSLNIYKLKLLASWSQEIGCIDSPISTACPLKKIEIRIPHEAIPYFPASALGGTMFLRLCHFDPDEEVATW